MWQKLWVCFFPAKTEFRVEGKNEDFILQDNQFTNISERIFDRHFGDNASVIFNLLYLPKERRMYFRFFIARWNSNIPKDKFRFIYIVTTLTKYDKEAVSSFTQQTLTDFILGQNNEAVVEDFNCESASASLEHPSDVNSLQENLATKTLVSVDKESTKSIKSKFLMKNLEIVRNIKILLYSPFIIKSILKNLIFQNIDPWMQKSKDDYQKIMSEHQNSALTISTEQTMIGLVVRGLQEVYGKNPPKEAIEATARAIIEYFPYLADKKGLLGYVRIFH